MSLAPVAVRESIGDSKSYSQLRSEVTPENLVVIDSTGPCDVRCWWCQNVSNFRVV